MQLHPNQTMRTNDQIPTQVKNPQLVDRRRRQIVDAAGISIGALYEYIASKEDILYLVCDAIHAEMERGVADAMERAKKGKNRLAEVIREYFLVCHRMNDHILLIYQETQSLPPKWRKIVL